MVPEGSRPCSYEHDTSPFPEPDEPSPRYLILFLYDPIISSRLCLGLAIGLFPSGFLTKTL